MCGNFGLLYLHNKNNNDNSDKNHDNINQASVDDELIMNSSYNGNDITQHVANEVIVTQIFEGNINKNVNSKTIILKEPLLILQHQAANTEIRGGQAGGYSSFEYTKCHNSIFGQRNIIASISQHSVHSLHESYRDNSNRPVINCNNNQSNSFHSNNDVIIDDDNDNNNNDKATTYEAEYNQIPDITRIRAVARKRVPLAGDLTAKYLHTRKGRRMAFDKTFTGEVQHRSLSLCLSLLITYLFYYYCCQYFYR